MSFRILSVLAITLAGLAVSSGAHAEDTIKIAFVDPLSGPFAQVGQQNLRQVQYVIDYINANGGALGKKFEVVSFDDKSQPSEALIALQSIADRNIPVLMQGNGSNIAAALIDGVEKHNTRNPDNRLIYVNYGAVATELTNEKCSFWHFRFDASAEQKALMLVRALPTEMKKVYLLNQDYLFGQSLKRDSEHFLTEYRPDVEIVGNELIPLGKVKDFSPYISKVKASGAQALITGNWGPDLSLLIKAGMDAGLDVKYYTLYAFLGGGPTAIGPGGSGRVFTLQLFDENVAAERGGPEIRDWIERFRSTNDFDFYAGFFRTVFEFLQAAINKAGSTDSLKIAQALEGMSRTDMLGQEVTMRAEDHQVLSPYYVTVFSRDVKYDAEKTGLGWKLVRAYEGKELALPTTCKMKRPGV